VSSYDRLLIERANLGGDCSQFDPELWFADERNKRDQRMAKGICSQCPKLLECQTLTLDYELETRQVEYGIYGGLTERERRKNINRERRGA
jgi:hypothetical protein